MLCDSKRLILVKAGHCIESIQWLLLFQAVTAEAGMVTQNDGKKKWLKRLKLANADPIASFFGNGRCNRRCFRLIRHDVSVDCSLHHLWCTLEGPEDMENCRERTVHRHPEKEAPKLDKKEANGKVDILSSTVNQLEIVDAFYGHAIFCDISVSC